MKRWLPFVALVLLTGCKEAERVSGADFQREYELRNAQTMVWSEYLGEKDGKAYLRRKTRSLVSHTWKEEVWFTETNHLNSAFLEQLKKEIVPHQAAQTIDAPPRACGQAQSATKGTNGIGAKGAAEHGSPG